MLQHFEDYLLRGRARPRSNGGVRVVLALSVYISAFSPYVTAVLRAEDTVPERRGTEARFAKGSSQVSKDIVAVYYLTGWNAAVSGKRSQSWDVPAKYHPLSGGYSSADPEVADRHIALLGSPYVVWGVSGITCWGNRIFIRSNDYLWCVGDPEKKWIGPEACLND